jgi:hypothetical protein
MRELSITWPKLIGRIIGIALAGLILWEVHDWYGRFEIWRGGFKGQHIVFVEWASLLLTIVLLFLGYFLYRARDWARRTLIVLGICLGGLVILDGAINAVQAASRAYEGAPKITLETRAGQACLILGMVGLRFFFVAPYAFLICALCHRDVAAGFHREATKRSNQATIQPTADRSDA